MRAAKARFIVGLTATPTRKDGHHPIIQMQCGPVRFSLNLKTMTEPAPFHHIVTPRPTRFQMPLQDADSTIQDVYRALALDEERNCMIAADIEAAIRENRSPLLLTGRTDHLKYFAEKLNGIAEHIFVLKDGMGKKERKLIDEAMKAVPEQTSRLILATGNLWR